MNLSIAEKIVAAVLYEGYILYPYRASAIKNRQRFNFGTLLPRAYSELQTGTESHSMHTECLAAGDDPSLEIRVRFLHPLMRQVGRLANPVAEMPASGAPDYEPLDSLEIAGELFQSWQEVVEQEVIVKTVSLNESNSSLQLTTAIFPATESVEALRDSDGKVAGVIVRRQQAVDVGVEVETVRLDEQLFRVGVTVRNLTELSENSEEMTREQALPQSLASAHVILGVHRGSFMSLLDPPEHFADAAAACRNEGCWPVLVGNEEQGDADIMLASPIILYDYPEIAPESDGDYFDGAEIDEMLALRVMTLTDDEKRQMRSVDERARKILERTEAMPASRMEQLHGAMRTLPSINPSS